MDKETLDKLNSYVDELFDLLEKGVKYIDNEQELVRFIDGIIGEEGWDIIAHDTHRWVETDGFYEVEFHLETSYGDVFINNKSGYSDLEEEWSNTNPQYCNSINECYLNERTWDWYYFLYELVKVLKKNINFE